MFDCNPVRLFLHGRNAAILLTSLALTFESVGPEAEKAHAYHSGRCILKCNGSSGKLCDGRAFVFPAFAWACVISVCLLKTNIVNLTQNIGFSSCISMVFKVKTFFSSIFDIYNILRIPLKLKEPI